MWAHLIVGFLPVLALGQDTALTSSEQAVIRRVGYPDARVREIQACGQRVVRKSFLNPDYIMWTLFGGFRDGTCAEIGYTNFEKTEEVKSRWVPVGPYRNIAFDIYTRDPTIRDVAGCIWRDCEGQLEALGSSAYVKDVAHCVSPAFGPCVPKAWACLGDDECSSALQCLPELARDCGAKVLKALEDPGEREMLACMWNCNNSKVCILKTCGKAALKCFTGIGAKLCHDAFTCIPKKMMSCSVRATKCIFNPHSSLCRSNLACLAKGAGVCADPAVNMMTDKSIANLLYCANDRCPALTHPDAGALTIDGQVTFPNGLDSHNQVTFPKWPGQLTCMTAKCGFKIAGLFADKNLHELSTCLLPGLVNCHDPMWDCLGDQTCQKDLQCWIDGLHSNAADIWKMATDKVERAYDEALYSCVKGCTETHENFAVRALCVAGKCGLKSAKCMLDSTCRHVFTDLPTTLAKCSVPSLLSPKFRAAAKCAANIANACGSAGVDLLRDRQLADLVTCNSKCTHAPQGETNEVVV